MASSNEIVFKLQKRKDRLILTSREVKQVLEGVLHNQPTIYEQGDNSQKEASQQEVIAVVIGRIADELGISLDD